MDVIAGLITYFRARIFLFSIFPCAQARNPAVEQQMPAILAALPIIMDPSLNLATPDVQERLRTGLAQAYGHTI